MANQPKIAFLAPVAESVPPTAFQYAMAAAVKAMESGLRIEQIGVTERTLIDSARNILAKGFLETDCEWAFWWDCDMVIPSNTIVQLFKTATEQNAKFVSAIYYQRLHNHLPVLWMKSPVLEDGTVAQLGPLSIAGDITSDEYRHFHCCPGPNNKIPFKADVCGFGCCLTHRDVFSGIKYPYFKTIAGVCSEDFYFCVEAKRAGFQLWADPVPRVGHIGQAEVIYKDHMKMELSKVSVMKQ